MLCNGIILISQPLIFLLIDRAIHLAQELYEQEISISTFKILPNMVPAGVQTLVCYRANLVFMTESIFTFDVLSLR